MDEFFLCVEEAKWNMDWRAGKYTNLDGETRALYRRRMFRLTDRFAPLCGSFSDEELLRVLRDRARELDRAPSQEEIFPVYLYYIRSRFNDWTTALRAAGLTR